MSRAWWTSRIIFCFIVLQVVIVRARTDTLPKEQVVDQPAPIVEQPHAPTSSNVAVAGVSCECQLFIQSWKTSNIIRLHMGIEPIRLNSSAVHLHDDLQNGCLAICKQQIPAQTEEYSALWNGLYRRACRALLANEYQVRQNLQQNSHTRNMLAAMPPTGPIKGCIQAYFRSSGAHVWVPMGHDYRRVLSCSQHQHQRRLRRSLAKNGVSGGPNSIDAQNVVAPEPDELSPPPPPIDDDEKTKRPLVLNTSPLRMALKQFGLFTPYVDGVLRLVEQVGLRELLDRFQLGNYIDRYHRIYDDYTEEVDVGHCFAEYIIYTVFNNRFAAGKIQQQNQQLDASTSRGLEEDVMGMVMNAATNFLSSDNAPEVLTTLFSMMPSKSASSSPVEKAPSNIQEPIPDVQDLAMTIARYYLRNYFSTLSGSTVRVDERDPTNNPETLGDMIEQVSRPVFLSVFGIVPGVPASGKLDHLLLIASKERPKTELKTNSLEWRNKLQSVSAGHVVSQPNIKTGNPFYDFGNMIVGTFQRANDATHGLYCAKQYMVNKMWDRFRNGMRRMMRTIPKSG